MKVKSICILGGGSAGFFAAAYLSRYIELSGHDIKVKCVYSSKIGNIGVGESTFFKVKTFFKYLGLDDKEWMPKCDATYKTSVCLDSWKDKETVYQYPFGESKIYHSLNHADFFIFNTLFPDKVKTEDFSRFINKVSRYAENNKLSDSCIPFTSYHFDTNKVAVYLKDYASKRGVEFVDDVYTESILNDSGNIDKIICENSEHSADLFIDASGFKGLLIDKVLGVKFNSFEETLINNKALVVKIPYTDKDIQMANFTRCTALENGWCWEIPLWESVSIGYVHSLRFSNEEYIENELREFVKCKYGVDNFEYKTVEYKSGVREYPWYKNVCSIGLSCGFIEPLESTGIATIVENCGRLAEVLSKRSGNITSLDKSFFNKAIVSEIVGYRKFIELHYAASLRDDSAYWKFVTEECEYEYSGSMQEALNTSIFTRNYTDKISGAPYILTGSGYTPYNKSDDYEYFYSNPMKRMDAEKKLEYWLDLDKEETDIINAERTTYKYTLDEVYSGS